MQTNIQNILKKLCPDDIYETGFADLNGLLNFEFKDHHYGITIIRKLDNDIIDKINKGPTEEYYGLYHSINNELNEKVNTISEQLHNLNIKALPINATVHDKDMDKKYKEKLRFKISHKMVATHSGLGWIGKTDLFISKKFGPRVRLASVLIDTPVEPLSSPINESLCGECSVCTKACPAGAANGKLWNINLDRNEFYDPFKCREYCRKISKINLGKEISICGICMSVCPKGKKA
jgi:epoxyqueuosine reductase